MAEQSSKGYMWDGVVKSCSPEILQELTEEGWVLLETQVLQTVTLWTEQVCDPNSAVGYPNLVTLTKPVQSTEMVCLVGKPKDLALQELKEGRDFAVEANREAQQALQVVTSSLKDKEIEVASLQRELDSCRKSLLEVRASTDDKVTDLQKMCQRMEEDISKVRSEIGEGQWRKILGSRPSE